MDTIPPLTLFKDEADTLELAPYFNDPDGDPLTFVATSSDRDVVAVTGSAGTLIATAVSQGEALVTVTATDDEGLTAQQSFEVTVPNRAPAVAITFPAQDLFKRDSLHLDLAGHFTDPDGDSLTLAAVSSDGGLAPATTDSYTHLRAPETDA